MNPGSTTVRFLTLPTLALSLSLNVGATEYSPGKFGASEIEFKQEFDTAEYDIAEELVIRCGSRLAADGKIQVLMCLSEDTQTANSKKAILEIRRIVRGLTLEAAKVDGDKVRVWYNFSVVLTPGAPEAAILNNHLYNEDILGRDYSAPQRYDYPRWRSCRKMPQSGIFIGAQISSAGEILEVSSVGGSHGYDSCIRKASNNVRNSKFIPAYSNGEPVSALFIEMFN